MIYDMPCIILEYNFRSDKCDPALWGRTMRGAQNDCDGFPTRRSVVIEYLMGCAIPF